MKQEFFLSIFGFIFLYIVLYMVLGMYFKNSTEDFDRVLSRSIDIFILVFILIVTLAVYYSSPSTDDFETHIKNLLSDFKTFLEDSWSLLYLGMILIVIYTVTYLFRIPNTNELKPFMLGLLENTTWIMFAIVLFEVTIRTLFNIDLVENATNFFNQTFPGFGSKTTTKDSSDNNIKPTPASVLINKSQTNDAKTAGNTVASGGGDSQHDEVFNIAGNNFTYEDAQTICSAYDSKIATYDQIEEAYNQGAEWCNYGWSEGQMAFFPTQKDTWNTLQKHPSTANNCGRPGVNGGYMANPKLRFGVNCFGKKPVMKESDSTTMKSYQQTINKQVPLTPEEAKMNEKMKYWKENASKLLNINGFNQNKWSEH
jgi:hypothetical protein